MTTAAVPSRAALRRWAGVALERDARVTLRLVGRAEGERLNARYRGKPYPTNVLTFVYDDVTSELAGHVTTDPGPVAGDLVLCVPVVRREAREQGKTFTAHCAHLVVHGMLHLQGYDHDTERTARRMEAHETALLAVLGIPDPYADAS